MAEEEQIDFKKNYSDQFTHRVLYSLLNSNYPTLSS